MIDTTPRSAARLQHLAPAFHPMTLLRVEGLAVFAASVTAYLYLGGQWGYLLLGFLADLSFVGYAVSPRVGAALYNLLHSAVLPLGLLATGLILKQELLTLGGLVMLSHIGLDRTAGYGLKYPDAFKHTHLDP